MVKIGKFLIDYIMTYFIKITFIFLLLTGFGIGSKAQSTEKFIEIKASHDSVYLDDAFTLTIRLKNLDRKGLNLKPLEDFRIIGIPRQSSMSEFYNGKMSSETTLVYQLTPKKAGKFSFEKLQVERDGNNYKPNKVKILVLDKYHDPENKEREIPLTPEEKQKEMRRKYPTAISL
jgi:hypothetical protein